MKKFTFLLLSVFFMLSSAVAADYEKLYVVGDATEIGWAPENAFEMASDGDGIFTWTGLLMDKGNNPDEDDRRFKFLTERGWSNTITCRHDVEGHLMINPGEENDLYPYTEGDGYDNSFIVPVTGDYMVKVDLNTMKMTCILIDDISEEPDLSQLYLVGGALSPEGEWEINNSIEMTKVSEGVFTWTGNLYNAETENGEGNMFKFLNEKGTWHTTIVAKEDNIEIAINQEYELNFRPFESSPDDFKFRVATAGEYTIDVNLVEMKMNVKDGSGLGIENINNVSLYNVSTLKGAVSVQADDLLQAVALYDITGKCLVSVANVGNEVAVGENLVNGIYIVKIVINNETYSQKVVIK